MEAIKFLINADGDYYTHHLAGEGEYYHKPEADAEIARLEAEIARYKSNIDTTEAATGMCGIYAGLEHQIEVLNADLTRCQESKAAIGDKCLRLEGEVERLKELLGSTTKRINLIMIDLLGFGGAALSESNRIFLKSLYNFLEDDSGLSEKLIAEELERKGVDVDTLLKRTDDLIKEMKAKQALSGVR